MGQARDVVEEFYARFNAGDLEGATAVFKPDVESTEPALGTVRTVQEWREYGEAFRRAMPDARLMIVSAIESGNTIAVEGRFSGTHTGPLASPQGEIPPSGRSIDIPYADFFELEDGRVARHRVYYDQLGMLTQLGLVPESQPAS